MMEGRIENRDLRDISAQQIPGCNDSLYIVRIVQWRKIDALLDTLEHPIVDQSGYMEKLAAMHHAVSDCMYVAGTLDFLYAGPIGCEEPDQVIQSRVHIVQRRSDCACRFLTIPNPENGLSADVFYFSPAEAIVLVVFDLLWIGRDNL